MEPAAADQYASYAAGWRKRWQERAAACLARAAEARTIAGRCAQMLADKHGARRVWLYGSSLTPERYHERSDIDLAAEGLDHWLRAGLSCESLARGFEVSLVPYEDATRSPHEGVAQAFLPET